LRSLETDAEAFSANTDGLAFNFEILFVVDLSEDLDMDTNENLQYSINFAKNYAEKVKELNLSNLSNLDRDNIFRF